MKQKITLFCLHFAGGNKYSYRALFQNLPSFITQVPIEAPGRGSRLREDLIDDIEKMTEDFYQQIKLRLGITPYAIYGHSMGALLAYLLTHKIKNNNHSLPVQLFLSGTPGPSSAKRQEKMRHLMDKEGFLNEIRALGGMPMEILDDKEMLEYFEPILRKDFKVSENYTHVENAPLPIPFTVLTGTNEDMEEDDITLWQKESGEPVDFIKFEGDHFFIYNHTNEIVKIISNKLNFYAKALNYE